MIALRTNCECGTQLDAQLETTEGTQQATTLECPSCHSLLKLARPTEAGKLSACLRCGTTELYQQKDFPQRIGVMIAVLASILATFAWYKYSAFWTFAVLFLFGFADFLPFRWCGNVLICYRCDGQHRGSINWSEHEYFELGINEKYRQEKLRKQQLREQGQKPIVVPPTESDNN